MIRFKQTSKIYGDCTADYEVTGFKSKNVMDVVDEIIAESTDDCGRICIGEGWFFQLPHCNYEWGKLLDVLPAEYLNKEVMSITAKGGYGQMDYFIKITE